jgi:bifunctional DNase/RNase
VRLLLCAACLLALAGPEALARERVPPPLRAEVWQVLGDPDGAGVVLLRTKAAPSRVVPVAVGPAEAADIRMRLSGAGFVPQETRDLLGALLKQLDTHVVQVRIERLDAGAVEGGVLYGRVFLRQGKQRLDVQARVSDAIGVALRAEAPLYLSAQVVERGGFPVQKFEGETAGDAHDAARSRRVSDPL